MIKNLIVDNILEEPDAIVDYALQQEYAPSEGGKWPGRRSGSMDERVFWSIANPMGNALYGSFENIDIDMNFQISDPLIDPSKKNQDDIHNRGWIHKDNMFHVTAGVIYLSKNPEDHTGTSLYTEIDSEPLEVEERIRIIETKKAHFLGKECDNYEDTWLKHNTRFEETVRVKNVYNRLVVFGEEVWHGVHTYGKYKPRLTVVWFLNGIVSNGKCYGTFRK